MWYRPTDNETNVYLSNGNGTFAGRVLERGAFNYSAAGYRFCC